MAKPPTLCVKFVQTIARAEYIQHLYDIFYNPVGRPGRETRSGDPVGRPGRETLLAHPRAGEARVILVALVLPGFINLCGLKHTITQSSNFMIKSSTSTINTKVGAEKKSS